MKNDSPDEAAQDTRNAGVPVVGIGASAGGLEAFSQLLSHLPEKTGMAFVLVQHLDPAHPSQLTEILAKTTRLPVNEVSDDMEIRQEHVYVIPPNTNMAIVNGLLRLTPRGEPGKQHLPVDFFFRSLAVELKSRAVGVVLSGTGSDGALGLAEIKGMGGITFAQNEDSARFAAMPLSAVSTGCVDFVLTPEEIAGELARIGRHPYLNGTTAPEEGPLAEVALGKILRELRSCTGISFGDYRDTTIKRRIARRMVLHRHESLSGYESFLLSNPAEVEALCQDILINVTSFFRDPEIFEALKNSVFPQITAKKSPEAPIRMWAPGCSTGQEAYSLAMVLLEFLDQRALRQPVQIFGTDVNDTAAVEKARRGLYPPSIESEVSPERLRRFFIKEEGGYRISTSLRDICVFARHDLTVDPPFSKLDLISCRNLLIYFSGELQKRIIPTFHYALSPGGFLVLGPSETVGQFSELFDPVDRKHNIYSRTAALTRRSPYFLLGNFPPSPAAGITAVERVPVVMDIQKEADRLILGRFAPAAVLIDENLEILQFRGRTRPYLESPAGQPTHNLLKMARGKLFLDLRSLIEQAKQTNMTSQRKGVRVQDEGAERLVDLEVTPIRRPSSSLRFFLVLFMDASAAHNTTTLEEDALPGAEATLSDNTENAELRQELASIKEYLQGIIEQQNAANEELQSANEEVRSANEELQSTNEELQTAKEELQSTNEELRTVNDELRSRNDELRQTSADLSNTLVSTQQPILILDRHLRIRRFTPAAGTLLNLIPTDLGRPFGDIEPMFDFPGLKAILLEVLVTASIKGTEIHDRLGRWYALAVHPYRGSDNQIDGVVLVLRDIDEEKRAKDQLTQAGEDKDQFLAALSHELRTPLTPVLATVAILQRDARLDADVRDKLDVIRRNAALEVRLIDDLLDVTRILKGKMELDRRPVDLSAVIQQAVDVCKSDIEARNLHLGVDAKHGPYMVQADAARLQQVFWNLLKNSIKFTPAGGCVGIRCRRDRDNNVIAEVNDSGEGIEPNFLGRIFNAFEQGRRPFHDAFGGLGLGLTISRSLVEMHGGTLTAHSAGRGKGATFTVRLPSMSTDTGAGLAFRADARPAEEEAVAPVRILLVEDHGDTATAIQMLLETEGHKVHLASDVATALRLAREESFDLLISDLGLPDGSGLDLVRALRTGGMTIPAIALSGYGQEQDIAKSRAVGFSTHLVKPVSPDELFRTVVMLSARRE